MADQAIWKTEGATKRSAVQEMFADIAPTYDCLNSVMSLRLHHRWRLHAVKLLDLKPGDHVLDVCCGTGDFMKPLNQAVGDKGKVFGVDFCLPMLKVAAGKLTTGLRDKLSMGDACQLPIQSGSLDGVSVGWGIRNVPDIDRAHRELYRVLRSGAKFVSLDMAIPRSALVRIPAAFVSRHVLPRLGGLFGKSKAYTYLPKSTEGFRSREELAKSMRDAGFTDVRFRDLFFGNICIHWGTKP
jgi:demethylmenaquinone methyltransferase/2-methoxy-6-polyprenyl-1,4-benzoquinol methylase